MDMTTLEVLESPARASALLDDMRLRIVAALRQPDSAAGVARRLGLPRQRVNYHLRALEKEGFVRLVEERRKGNCTERVVQANASAYLVGPGALGGLAPDVRAVRDRFSVACLVAVAARVIADVGMLSRRADTPVSTMALQADIRFASSEDRDAFAEDLKNEIANLVREYHDDSRTDGRVHRVIIGAYPAITTDEHGNDLPADEADVMPGAVR